MMPFNGVATKDLPNYLNWFNYKQAQKENKEKLKAIMLTCLSAATALTVDLLQKATLIKA